MGGQQYALDVNQLLLKGANLKNTGWVIAFTCFTGNETRLMLNSKEGKPKLSNLEKQINVFVLWILISQLILCVSLGLMAGFWSVQGPIEKEFYIPFEFALHTEGILTFFRYFLLMSTFLPISLFVTLETLKIWQSVMVGWDYRMISIERGKPAFVSNSGLIEEIG